ncbi:MAG: C4-dicarboxylic acid transporter DauA [Halioglobus sp.]|nr:C4-dicarboxylic acid transporter DauA [Halioglobus sp.]
MPRQHLFSLRFAHALREVMAEGYGPRGLTRDVIAGLTVGVIAIPLSMALAIASGVEPEHGLYTAIFAGVIAGVAGGSRYSVTGPTAAFVIILQPLVVKHGLAALLLCTVLSGVLLVAMARARLGRYIEYIPEAVTLGFTGGIAVVIVVLQVPDLLGLHLGPLPDGLVEKLAVIRGGMHAASWPAVGLSVFTLLVLLAWPAGRTRVPPHLPALVLASLLGWVLNRYGLEVDTIGSRFSYLLPDGTRGAGVPSSLPSFQLPWTAGQQSAEELLALLPELLPAAFAIAMLGAIESLLCAVVLDGMSGKRHSANSELLGQGLANIITPFFGGISATAAIARSAVNFKSGACSPVATVIHALVVLSGLLFLSRILSYLPMPAMAALLLFVAWNMSEAPKARALLKKAPAGDIAVFLICLSLTILFDMVIAITAGVLIASLLFMKNIAALTTVSDAQVRAVLTGAKLPSGWKVFALRGPLFFAAADRCLGELSQHIQGLQGVILDMRDMPYLDAGGLAALKKLAHACEREGVAIRYAHWQFQPLKTLARAREEGDDPIAWSYPDLGAALADIEAACGPGERREHDAAGKNVTELRGT